MQNKQTSVKQGTWNAIWAFQNKDIQKIGKRALPAFTNMQCKHIYFGQATAHHVIDTRCVRTKKVLTD